jgi:hypothetical protein
MGILAVVVAVLVVIFIIWAMTLKTGAGTVTAVEGNLPGLVPSEGAWFGNKSVKFGKPMLAITVQVNKDMKFHLQIEEGIKPLAALALALKPGVVVTFDYHWMTDDRIRTINSDNIKVIG